MSNLHKLKRSNKSMADQLRNLYNSKLIIENKLGYINVKISQIEKAKHNCLNNIRKKKNDKK